MSLILDPFQNRPLVNLKQKSEMGYKANLRIYGTEQRENTSSSLLIFQLPGSSCVLDIFTHRLKTCCSKTRSYLIPIRLSRIYTWSKLSPTSGLGSSEPSGPVKTFSVKLSMNHSVVWVSDLLYSCLLRVSRL